MQSEKQRMTRRLEGVRNKLERVLSAQTCGQVTTKEQAEWWADFPLSKSGEKKLDWNPGSRG